jgi:serralysin
MFGTFENNKGAVVAFGALFASTFTALPSSAFAAGVATVTPWAPGYSCVRNFYVATTGSDAATGTTASTPWQTIQHANDSGQLQAGDCVNVADGTYPLQGALTLTKGGNANSATGYVVYRSTNPQGAKIQAVGSGMYDVVDVNGDYVVIDGFEVDGGNAGLTSNPVTNGTGIGLNGHHMQALNNVVHDAGGGGIEAVYKDWYWIVGNTVYNNAHFNGYQMSGISVYEPRAVSYNATPADSGAPYHIIVQNNLSHDNGEWYVAGSHTDGNGIIMDDFNNSQSGGTPYPYQTLVQGNLAYSNGGKGVHLFGSSNVTVDQNAAVGNNLDSNIQATWRGELNDQGSNNVWTNNVAIAASVASDPWRQYNTAVVDAGGNSNVIWMGNSNLDTRTGGQSYQIDNPTTAAGFPANNPLGKAL